MPYTPNTCTENAEISDTKIEELYPEILISNPTYDSGETDDSLISYYAVATDIAMTMDILATVGRSYYTITLVEKDHGPVLKDYLAASVSNGYNVSHSAEVVTVACTSC